ncbi:MAG: Na/Pi cotransporter family protein [Clostridia bacterium]|nr:Na/Pi cotransporter family protein [Clostridia bacterium]
MINVLSASSLQIGDIIFQVVQLLAGLGAFLIGVQIMSDSMTNLANVGMKKMFQRIGNNKFVGVGIGAASTAIIQSSSVTTVMVVGFVNAGVMTLQQATTIIMGANIGTTITAQIAALQSFDFMQYVIILTFVGFFAMSIAKSEKWKTFWNLIAGLGLIFLALEIMSMAVEPFKESDEIKQVLASINNPFLLLLAGVLLTCLLQSSSAVTTIVIVMASGGLIIGGTVDGGVSNGALFVILGSNIGTCITAILAMTNANTNAKRSAIIHLLFNLLGSVIFFVFLMLWPTFMQNTLNKWFVEAGTQIAMFHTFFNVTCTLLFLPFTHLFVKLATLILPDKKAKESATSVPTLKYVDDRFVATPSIAVHQAKKEVREMGDIIMQTCDEAVLGFVKTDTSKEAIVAQRLQDVSVLNQRLVQYLVSVSANVKTSTHSEGTISNLYYVMGDVLRVGDLSHNITKYTQKVANGEVTFSETVYVEVQKLYSKVRELYSVAMDCFLDKDFELLKVVESMEEEIDGIRRDLVNRHIERLNKGECNPASNGVFINLIGNLERMADHLTFIAESITKHPDTYTATATANN